MSEMRPIEFILRGAEPASPRISVRGALEFASALLARGVAAWRSREAVRALARLDDRMLKDMGLTRGDIEGALRWPLTGDPTLRLAACRLDRTSGFAALPAHFEAGDRL